MNRLFHVTKGIPEQLRIAPSIYLYYDGAAAMSIHREGNGGLPYIIPINAEVIEVETTRDLVPLRWILQFPYTTERDIVVVVKANGRVTSAWTPKRNRSCNQPIGPERYTALADYLKQVEAIVPPENQGDYLKLAQHEFGLDNEPEERTNSQASSGGLEF